MSLDQGKVTLAVVVQQAGILLMAYSWTPIPVYVVNLAHWKEADLIQHISLCRDSRAGILGPRAVVPVMVGSMEVVAQG